MRSKYEGPDKFAIALRKELKKLDLSLLGIAEPITVKNTYGGYGYSISDYTGEWEIVVMTSWGQDGTCRMTIVIALVDGGASHSSVLVEDGRVGNLRMACGYEDAARAAIEHGIKKSLRAAKLPVAKIVNLNHKAGDCT